MNCEQADRERNLVKALISDISHQVRTPLTNIMLYAGLLEEQELPEQAGKMASQIHRQADKLDFFMKELVRSSYLETEMIAVHVEKSSVDELIARACQAVEMQALAGGFMWKTAAGTASCLVAIPGRKCPATL